MLLLLLDIFFDVLHLAVILLNLFGWIWPATRVAQRWLLGATAFCWLVIGPMIHSLGFCPLTEWHWEVKAARGVTNLPDSYPEYLLQQAGIFIDPSYIEFSTGALFAMAVMATGIVWWREIEGRKRALIFQNK